MLLWYFLSLSLFSLCLANDVWRYTPLKIVPASTGIFSRIFPHNWHNLSRENWIGARKCSSCYIFKAAISLLERFLWQSGILPYCGKCSKLPSYNFLFSSYWLFGSWAPCCWEYQRRQRFAGTPRITKVDKYKYANKLSGIFQHFFDVFCGKSGCHPLPSILGDDPHRCNPFLPSSFECGLKCPRNKVLSSTVWVCFFVKMGYVLFLFSLTNAWECSATAATLIPQRPGRTN